MPNTELADLLDTLYNEAQFAALEDFFDCLTIYPELRSNPAMLQEVSAIIEKAVLLTADIYVSALT